MPESQADIQREMEVIKGGLDWVTLNAGGVRLCRRLSWLNLTSGGSPSSSCVCFHLRLAALPSASSLSPV